MEKQRPLFKEILNWPESMWPIRPDFLDSYNKDLLPDVASLSALTYPWELMILLRKTLGEKIKGSRISEHATLKQFSLVEGPVWVEDGVTIFPFAHITGPAYIGEGSVVGQGAVIRGGVYIGKNSDIGVDSEVGRSILANKCSLHNAKVLDSLVSSDVHFGSANTANFRLDGKNITSYVSGEKVDTGLRKLGAIFGEGHSFIGMNASTNPGVKIGARCYVYPGASVSEDVPGNSRLVVKQQQQISLRNE